jgi:FkbH-like protein
VDGPRIAQLVGRSNQFNLTTRRRTEAEVQQMIDNPACWAYTMRLEDRFGDYGLIAGVVGRVEADVFHVDTWLMSCPVLKRQVEEAVNEMGRLAKMRGCSRIHGLYLPTEKNGMVRDLYPRMGFTAVVDEPDHRESGDVVRPDGAREFGLDVCGYHPVVTKIEVLQRTYDSSRSDR